MEFLLLYIASVIVSYITQRLIIRFDKDSETYNYYIMFVFLLIPIANVVFSFMVLLSVLVSNAYDKINVGVMLKKFYGDKS